MLKRLLLASTFVLAIPVSVFAQTSAAGSMSDPTTSSNPSTTIGPNAPNAMTPGDSMTSAPATSTMSATYSKLSAKDKQFIHAAAIAGLAEVNDGQLAEQMGDNSVKQIGTRMVTDHSKANDQLATLSMRLGDPAPIQTDSKHMQMSDTLKTKSGSAFDTAYLETVLTGHEKTIALFKKEISSGSNGHLKNFAQTTLPILEMHLSMIKSALQA